jgi:hypothetical protein
VEVMKMKSVASLGTLALVLALAIAMSATADAKSKAATNAQLQRRVEALEKTVTRNAEFYNRYIRAMHAGGGTIDERLARRKRWYGSPDWMEGIDGVHARKESTKKPAAK